VPFSPKIRQAHCQITRLLRSVLVFLPYAYDSMQLGGPSHRPNGESVQNSPMLEIDAHASIQVSIKTLSKHAVLRSNL